MAPVQLGVGIPFGCQIGAKGAQCAFDAPKTVSTWDGNSAFNTEPRQDTFLGVSDRAPRLLRYYVWDYGRPTPPKFRNGTAIAYQIDANHPRRQLHRCQANHPLSYEAFFRANQPADGHPADDTWDYGQLYRLHMIQAQAAQQDIPRLNITENDVDNYLIRIALLDRQYDIDATSSHSMPQVLILGIFLLDHTWY